MKNYTTTSLETISQDLNTAYEGVAELQQSIANVYTKTESDGRYDTKTEVNGKIANAKNLLPYATAATIALTLTQSVYKTTATGGVLPSITLTGIETSDDYFCFEVEAAIPSGATLDPTAWASVTWLPGFELPQYDYAGKTLYISCRLDCQTRGVTASCWRVA
jgi:hypothetical protein